MHDKKENKNTTSHKFKKDLLEYFSDKSIKTCLEIGANWGYTTRVLDGPYPVSEVVYNVRAKGVNYTNHIFDLALHNPTEAPIAHYYVKDGKLFTYDHKHIKVWHLAEGMHGRPLDKFNELTDIIKTKLFNDDTIKFFKEQCGCAEFFS